MPASDGRSFRGPGFRNRGNSEVDWTNLIGSGSNDSRAGPPGQMQSRMGAQWLGSDLSSDRGRTSLTTRLSASESNMRVGVLSSSDGMKRSSSIQQGSSSGTLTSWRHSMQGSSASSSSLGMQGIQGSSSGNSWRNSIQGELNNGRSMTRHHSEPVEEYHGLHRGSGSMNLKSLGAGSSSSSSNTPRSSNNLHSPRSSQIADSGFRDKVMDQMVCLGFLLVSEHELVLKEHTSRLEKEVALLRKVSNHEPSDRALSARGSLLSEGNDSVAAGDEASNTEDIPPVATSGLLAAAVSAAAPPAGVLSLDFGAGNMLDPVQEEQHSAQQNGASLPVSATVNGEGIASPDADKAPGELMPSSSEARAEANDVKGNKRLSVQPQVSSRVAAMQRARFSQLMESSVKQQQVQDLAALNEEGDNSMPGCPAIGEEKLEKLEEDDFSEKGSAESHQSHQEAKNGKTVMFGDLGRDSESEKMDLSSPDLRFPMWDVWLVKSSKDSVFSRASFMSRRASEAKSGFFDLDDDSDDSNIAKEMAKSVQRGHSKTWKQRKLECQHRIIAHPSSARRMVWEFLGCFFVCFESVTIPTQFLELPPNEFLNVMSWLARIFWSMDLPASFLVGYRRGVHTEMRPRRIALNYLKTWFMLDFAILAADWYDVFAASGSMETARMGRTLKTTRIIRMVRLLRLLRLQRVPDFALAKSIAFYFRSEFTHIFLGILKIMIFFTWVNHVISCLWYALGRGQDGHNWMKGADMEDEVFDYKYATSFHWSLTQFTGSMEVFPTNSSERFFAVGILLLAFFISASVVSAITSMMTRLEIATAQESERFTLLKQYLFDNHITSKVALRVERNAQHALAERKRNTPESSIELLGLVSEPLRVELHFEINMPVLGYHPFFRNYSLTSPSTMRQVCHQCVARLTLSRSDVLFRVGEVAVRMFFVVSGRLTYIRAGNDRCDTLVNVGDWACEAVIWTPWANVGTLRVKTDCTLAMIDVERFQQLALQYDMDGHAKKYGERFLRFLNNANVDDLTDLEDPNMDTQDLADITCPPPQHEDQTLMSRLNYHMRWLNRHSAKRSQREDSWFKPSQVATTAARTTGVQGKIKRSTVRNTEINFTDLNSWKGKFGLTRSRDPSEGKK